MSTYYNRHKTATITDRDQVAAIERLLEVVCEASGVEVVDDPSPNQVGGVFFDDVFGIHSGDYLGFEEVRRRHTRTELVTVNGWAYESTDDAAWVPVFDPMDIERDTWNCNGWDYVVTELGSGGRRPIYEITILSEDGPVSTGVFTENYDASAVWVDGTEE